LNSIYLYLYHKQIDMENKQEVPTAADKKRRGRKGNRKQKQRRGQERKREGGREEGREEGREKKEKECG